MRAHRYHGAKDVSVDTVSDPGTTSPVRVPGVYTGLIHGFLFGDDFEKGPTFRMGQTHVQKYLPERLELIAEGYKLFDQKQEDCRKVILTP